MMRELWLQSHHDDFISLCFEAAHIFIEDEHLNTQSLVLLYKIIIFIYVQLLLSIALSYSLMMCALYNVCI